MSHTRDHVGELVCDPVDENSCAANKNPSGIATNKNAFALWNIVFMVITGTTPATDTGLD
jgi:hypothetical protein